MIDRLKYHFCGVEIFDNYLIVSMNEGIHLEPDHNEILVNIVDTYFRNKPFVYITNRKNSYSVNPAIYLKTSKIENLEGFAIVTKKYNAKINAEIERMFLTKPLEIFEELQDAVDWAKAIIENRTTN